MIWNEHSRLRGTHAVLSPSSHSWMHYDEDKLVSYIYNIMAKERGTELHDFAERAIKLGEPLEHKRRTLNLYVNDAIRYNMEPEKCLYYSEYIYGWADSISFNIEKKYSKTKPLLRIHDLKTGVTKASFEQLDGYAALFCLEYDHNPRDILFEERIYQNDEVHICNPTIENILPIMDQIRFFDQVIRDIKAKEGV